MVEQKVNRQDYKVVIKTLTEREYIVNGRSPEQAQAEAESLYSEGDIGHILSDEIYESDAYPFDDETEEVISN